MRGDEDARCHVLAGHILTVDKTSSCVWPWMSRKNRLHGTWEFVLKVHEMLKLWTTKTARFVLCWTTTRLFPNMAKRRRKKKIPQERSAKSNKWVSWNLLPVVTESILQVMPGPVTTMLDMWLIFLPVMMHRWETWINVFSCTLTVLMGNACDHLQSGDHKTRADRTGGLYINLSNLSCDEIFEKALQVNVIWLNASSQNKVKQTQTSRPEIKKRMPLGYSVKSTTIKTCDSKNFSKIDLRSIFLFAQSEMNFHNQLPGKHWSFSF